MIRSHDAAGARSRADTARLHPRRRRRPLPPRRRSLGGDVHISRSSAALALARAVALLLLSVPCLVCSCYCSCSRCCAALPLGPLPGLLLLFLLLLLAMLLRFGYTSVDRINFWVSRFSRGGLAGVKEEPAAAGREARRRGTPLSILGFRMGAVVAGGGGALAGRWRGDLRRKSSAWGA